MQKVHIANSDKPVRAYSLDVTISVGEMSGTSTRTERLTIRVPRELLAQLRAQAVRDGVSVASVVLRDLGCIKIDGKCTKIDEK